MEPYDELYQISLPLFHSSLFSAAKIIGYTTPKLLMKTLSVYIMNGDPTLLKKVYGIIKKEFEVTFDLEEHVFNLLFKRFIKEYE